MSEITVIFPDQLFPDHPAVIKSRRVALIEDELFFRQYKFHKKKIVLHRASMKAYEQALMDRGMQVRYFNSFDYPSLQVVFDALMQDGYRQVHLVSPDDYLLGRRIKRFASRCEMTVKEYESPGFICSYTYLQEFFHDRNRYFLTDFYIAQRKRLDILIYRGDPIGGKWTFDTENRKKMPASVSVPPLPTYDSNAFVKEALRYVQDHFADHYGSADHFLYPVTRQDALEGLHVFLQQRFHHFGIYQDAIVEQNSFLFHAVLTPALNIGLITPAEVLDESLEFSRKHNVPINSLEGFVRQILGWREFVRALYRLEGVRIRTANHWSHYQSLPSSFWTGTTGVGPVDNIIQKVLKNAYSNHIERLMVMGNFMMLCEFDPHQVYRWFMELYNDAYDWVMVPNVYGMSQFADGGLMSTKPYISGSNYLLNMSNYKKGEWCDVWDALYWCFIEKHRDAFLQNPRMSMMVRMWDKMEKTRRHALHQKRERFINTLTTS